MDLEKLLESSNTLEPSWHKAKEIVDEIVTISPNLFRLIYNSWNGNDNINDFLHILAFSGLNIYTVILAADLPPQGTEITKSMLLKLSVQELGAKSSALILAINATINAIQESKPPTAWQSLFTNMINDIHIGYHFGTKSNEMGAASGALIGFSKTAGLGILMAYAPKSYRKILELQKQQIQPTHELLMDLFGCEPYQVSAMLIQKLGFGLNAAIGAVYGLSNQTLENPALDFIVKKWRAAYQWIDALREGKNYPADLEIRNAFPAITPPPQGKKNQILELLYLDVAKIRQKGSPWKWHTFQPNIQPKKDMVDNGY